MLVYYLFAEVVLDVEDLSIAQYGLLVDLDLTAHVGTRTFNQLQGKRAVEVVLVPTPDVLERNLLKQESNDWKNISMLYDLIKVEHASHVIRNDTYFFFQMRVTSHTCTVYYRKKLLNWQIICG